MPENEINELSEREREILRLVATGASNKEIAQQLFISANTVKVHLRNIFAKVGVASRTEAAMYAVRMGMAETAASVQDEAGSAGVAELVTEPHPNGGRIAKRGLYGVTRRTILLSSVVFLLLLALAGFLARRSLMNIAEAGQPPATAYPRWQEHTPLPTARQGLAAVVYNEKIYTIGGETGQEVVGQVEMFDPASEKWQSLSPKPVAVADISSVVVGGLFYVPGGRMASGEPTDILEVYDPLEDRWEARSPLPVALSAYALASFEGRIFLFGGWDGSGYRNEVYEYDPSEDRWTERTPMPTRRGFAGAAEAAGKIFVIGGYDGQQALAVNESYTPNMDSGQENPWSEWEPLPEGRYAMGLTSVADIIHLLGGEGEAGAQLLPLEFFPHRDEWQSFESPISQSWSRLSLVPYETQLYLMGGQMENQPVSRNLSYLAIFTVLFPEIR